MNVVVLVRDNEPVFNLCSSFYIADTLNVDVIDWFYGVCIPIKQLIATDDRIMDHDMLLDMGINGIK